MIRTPHDLARLSISLILVITAWSTQSVPAHADGDSTSPARKAPNQRQSARPALEGQITDAQWPGVVKYPKFSPLVAEVGRSAGEPLTAEQKATQALAGVKKGSADYALLRAVRGMARYRLGRYALAVADLKAAAALKPAFADRLRFFEAESTFHQGRYGAAEKLFEKLIKVNSASQWAHRARFRVADCLLGQGKHREGIRRLRSLLDTYPEYPHQAAALMAIAEGERARGRLSKVAGVLSQVVRQHPGDPLALVARRSLEALEAQGISVPAASPDTLYEVGYKLRRQKFFERALKVLGEVAEHPKAKSALKRKARYQMARTLYQMERYDDALAAFKAWGQSATIEGHRRQSLRWQSYVLEKMGKTKEAVAALKASAGNPERLPSELLEDVAWLYFNAAEYMKAREHFALLSRRGGEFSGGTRWLRAWSSFQLGEYLEAADTFAQLRSGTRWPEKFTYWYGRAMAQAGEVDTAAEAYREVIASTPVSYYAYQSRARLAELGMSPAEGPLATGDVDPDGGGTSDDIPAAPTCREDDDDCQQQTLAQARATSQPEIDDGPLLAPVLVEAPPPGSTHLPTEEGLTAFERLIRRYGGVLPDLQRAHQLVLTGELWAARGALHRVSDELADFRKYRRKRRSAKRWAWRPEPYADRRRDVTLGEWGRDLSDTPRPAADARRGQALAKLLSSPIYGMMRSAYIQCIGDAYYARRYFNKKGTLVGLPESEEHNPAWANMFRQAFRPIVEHTAARYGLDPYFLWSLMTVESAYNPLAISHAGARGLMQVMPFTGRLVADRMGMRNFGPAMLLEPEVALELGGWYFNQLLTKFNGQLPLAIASYNAGPHRVAAWLKAKGHINMDEFVEEIPYPETRRYTKRVLQYLALYRRIYDREIRFEVGQQLDPNFRDNINF
ncbi:MAG: transglycosylase SLT domain-containing protein [Bradymonadia bacterium]